MIPTRKIRKTAQGYAIKFIQRKAGQPDRTTKRRQKSLTAKKSYGLLHHLMVADELTRSCHARIRHAYRHLQPTETATHARGKVAVLGVRGGLLEGTEVVFAFVVFFFATVAAVWAFGAIAAVVCSAMSVRAMLVFCLLRCCVWLCSDV